MSSENHTTSSPLSLLAAPFQIVLAFTVSLILIFGVGYGSAWITDQSCPICAEEGESQGSEGVSKLEEGNPASSEELSKPQEEISAPQE